MNNKHFSREEIVAILDAAYREMLERCRLEVTTPEAAEGWGVAIAHLAEVFGVVKEWHDYTPPARAEKIQ